MTNHLHESLSALMDNEADELELRRVLKELESGTGNPGNGEGNSGKKITAQAELKAKWRRYHIVSASLKQEIHSSPSCNLLAGIQAELEQDAIPTLSLVDTAARKGVFRLFGQGAIAASVALAVLFTADLALNTDNNASTGNAAQLADSDTAMEMDELPGFTGDLNPATNTRVAVQTKLNPEDMSRLERVVSAELKDALVSPATYAPDSDR